MSFKSRNGVVYTPDQVSKAVIENLRARDQRGSLEVLEPSAGDGSFLRALRGSLPNFRVTAVDKSKWAYKTLVSDYPDVSCLHSDFLSWQQASANSQFDWVVGNPPFVRHSSLTKLSKRSVSKLQQLRPDLPFNLSNLWAAFLVAALDALRPNGLLAFVLPYELLGNRYGKSIQRWLNAEIGSVDIYISKTRAFLGIDQDAIVLVVEKTELHRHFKIHLVDSLADIGDRCSIHASADVKAGCPISHQKLLLTTEALELVDRLSNALPKLADITESSAGIVTGANSYFIQPMSVWEERGLDMWARPIVQKVSDLDGKYSIEESDLRAWTEAGDVKAVLDFNNEVLEDLTDEALDYLAALTDAKVDKRYKCSTRPLWYQVPMLDAAPLYFFKRSHKRLRFVRNRTKMLTTDGGYRVYPGPGYSPDGVFYSFHNSLTYLMSEVHGRFYGGGVLELTPSEFRSLPIAYEVPTTDQLIKFEKKLSEYGQSSEDRFGDGDRALRRRLQLTEDQLATLQKAHVVVQKHRLRHGRSSIGS